jgi:hypothetical protein
VPFQPIAKIMRDPRTHKLFLAGLSLLLLSPVSSAQSISAVGIKAGLTRANQRQVYSNFETLLESRTAFDVGVFAEWFDHPWLRLNTEMHFVRKSTGFPDMPITTTQYPDGTGEFIKNTFMFDFISVSILPKLRATIGFVEIYGLVGPRFDFLFHRAVTVDGPEPIRSMVQLSFDSLLRRYKEVQLGGDFALGCQFSGLALPGIGFEARYSPDFTTSYEYFGATVTNRSWEFLITVTF